MNVYGTKQIRNVVLLGHGGAGKTTAAEAMALVTGVTKRMGKVPDGTTISDYDKEEIKRQFSISTSLIPIEYSGENGPIKINLLDTPGYFDFVGEVEEAMSVADAVQSIPHRGAQILGAACAALLLAEASGIRPDELFGMARNCMNHADGRRPEFAAVSDYIHNEGFHG